MKIILAAELLPREEGAGDESHSYSKLIACQRGNRQRFKSSIDFDTSSDQDEI